MSAISKSMSQRESIIQIIDYYEGLLYDVEEEITTALAMIHEVPTIRIWEEWECEDSRIGMCYSTNDGACLVCHEPRERK